MLTSFSFISIISIIILLIQINFTILFIVKRIRLGYRTSFTFTNDEIPRF